MDKLQYLSPSSFYYWEKCPFQAVLSKQPTTKTFFPTQPDADLGSLIHRFYEKQNEWDIDSVEKFNVRWKNETDILNKLYKANKLLGNHCSIQWNAKYYAIKKQLLCKNLLTKISEGKEASTSGVQYLYEQWINNELIGGKIDLLIKENDEIKQIIDFKTGNIFEKVSKKMQLKEVYKQQLALYCAVIIEKQDFFPELLIETMDGRRVRVEVAREYIEALIRRVKLLKDKINYAIETNTIDLIANCNPENCEHCNYRPLCKIYKTAFINKNIGSRIDISGKITVIKKNEIAIETANNYYLVKKIKEISRYQVDAMCEIYNLYFPENDNSFLYETANTTIRYV